MKTILKQSKLISILALAGVLSGCGTAGSIVSESREDQEFFVVNGENYKAGKSKGNIYERLISVKGSNCTDYGSHSGYMPHILGFGSTKLFECNPVSASAKKGVGDVLKDFNVPKMPAAKS